MLRGLRRPGAPRDAPPPCPPLRRPFRTRRRRSSPRPAHRCAGRRGAPRDGPEWGTSARRGRVPSKIRAASGLLGRAGGAAAFSCRVSRQPPLFPSRSRSCLQAIRDPAVPVCVPRNLCARLPRWRVSPARGSMTIALDASPFHPLDLGIGRSLTGSPASSGAAPCAPLHVSNEAWSNVGMDSERDSDRSKMSAVEEIRPILRDLVREQEAACGSRMLAYAAVGRMIRIGETWVRRCIGSQVSSLDADLYKRILSAEEDAQRRRIASAEALLMREKLKHRGGAR